MSRHDDAVALRQMRDHAAEAAAIAQGRSRSDFDADRLFALGLTKLIEIIGEAAGRVSQATRQAHPGTPWKQIVGTRHWLVHGYDQVDFDVLWRIVSDELPPLVEQLDAILSGETETGS